MNTIIQKGNLIRRIRDGNDLKEIAAFVKENLFRNGPVDSLVLEIASYIKLFQPEFFSTIEDEVIEMMGLFFKNPPTDTIRSLVFDMYHQHIKELYGEDYTPVQANILKQMQGSQFFSFSAPTSTGKSFVFRNLIISSSKDVAVIVPSRALINEYYDRINELVPPREVNVLTFVDHINTKYAKRNIFILTPERARELFKNKEWLNIEFFLFDEAQLSDEKSVRGLYFDSIVRRAIKTFETSKFVFAHPFISNPQAQLKKNNVVDAGVAQNYLQKNVGQIFYVHQPDKDKFYHLGTSKSVFGERKLEALFDPIENTIRNGGSILVYVPKTHIYSKSVYDQFAKYINMCTPIQDPEAIEMIKKLRDYIGASNQNQHFYNSEMLEKLSYGIVTHHGSMPLAARLILEHFTQKGFCRICFATSTLEQGINMPFDLVYLDRFEGSKSLSVKNLIGRAGRSTTEPVFDFGSVVIRENAMTKLREIIHKQEPLSDVSRLDIAEDTLDEKYNEFKDAINGDTFSDEFNMPQSDLEKLRTDDVTVIIPTLLDMMISENGQLIQPSEDAKEVYDDFNRLYALYLGRELVPAEKAVLNSAIKIMIWKVYGRTFREICQLRYAYASSVQERRNLIRQGKNQDAENLRSKYLCGYHDIPDKQLKSYPLFSTKINAQDVDYDLIVFDTYDFLDKLIGFRLSDLFYAMFYQYYDSTKDEKALKLALFFKYGTAEKKEIWMLRYGFTFEDMEWVSDCIDQIDETEIVFNDKVNELNDEQRELIMPFYGN